MFSAGYFCFLQPIFLDLRFLSIIIKISPSFNEIKPMWNSCRWRYSKRKIFKTPLSKKSKGIFLNGKKSPIKKALLVLRRAFFKPRYRGLFYLPS